MSQIPLRVEVPGHALDRVVGRGSTATVWAGRDPMGRAVALKVPHEAPDAVDLSQAATERHVLTALRHDHLVSLRDVVPLRDGRVVTVFDLVEGATLRSTVDARGRLRPGEAVTVLTPVCDAVVTLHRAGATHGDISPGNVLITAHGRPLLADLGSARVAGAGAAVFGTPGFVAPEVRAGQSPTQASDVFALGALAWFCLTGNGAPDTTLRLSPDTIASHLGAELAGVVGACIDPDPTRRPSAERLGELFYDAATAEPIEVVVGADDASALTHRLRLNAAAALPEPRRQGTALPALVARLRGRRVPGPRLLTAVSVVVVLSFAGVLAWSGSRTGDDVATPSSAAAPVAVAARAPGATAAARETERATASTPEPTARATGTSADVTSDQQAPSRSPVALLRTLSERRAAMLVSADTGALGLVHATDSPSWRSDAALLDQLRRSRQGYAGLAVASVEAETVLFEGSRAVLRARVAHTAYDVVDAMGRRTRQSAVDGGQLDFALVRTPQGWRIEAISVPAAT